MCTVSEEIFRRQCLYFCVFTATSHYNPVGGKIIFIVIIHHCTGTQWTCSNDSYKNLKKKPRNTTCSSLKRSKTVTCESSFICGFLVHFWRIVLFFIMQAGLFFLVCTSSEDLVSCWNSVEPTSTSLKFC